MAKEGGTWFHWAPTERRRGINHKGLMPGQWSRDRLWRPPYICLTHRPSWAWGLSGQMDREKQIKHWDLWEVWLPGDQPYEVLRSLDGSIDEIRVYERIFKRNVWYVGSREL